jgi:hypothetical protein
LVLDGRGDLDRGLRPAGAAPQTVVAEVQAKLAALLGIAD